MRWDCPGIGPVSPVEFIPIAEDSGLILKLGAWILREACAQARRWARLGHPIRVAVNVSARQVEQREFVRLVASTFEATALDPTLLELELTEGAMMRHDGIARRNIERLRRMGVRIAIDDFGTGYSALSYLNTLPLDRLKIDRSFIAALGGDEFQADVTRSVIALAHRRRLTVVAEGVETAEQARRLVAMGCDEVQGFLFGVPSTVLEVTAMLERERLGALLGPERVAMPA
jgi:EAL domain-containing protein (putative c-di-GMP-specific phosphodiesterase class I)